MRGQTKDQVELFSYISIEDRVPPKHPLRKIQRLVDEILRSMTGRFDAAYAKTGRPSIAPEYLLKALFLQILYTIRSERQIVEHLNYNLLYRWFVGLSSDDPIWDHSTFSKNRDRLIAAGIADEVFFFVVGFPGMEGLVFLGHFYLGGTFILDWASFKKIFPKSEDRQDDN